MLKNQHTYAEISADRAVPKPLQPPHLLYFDILTVPYQKEVFSETFPPNVPFFYTDIYDISVTFRNSVSQLGG